MLLEFEVQAVYQGGSSGQNIFEEKMGTLFDQYTLVGSRVMYLK